MAVKNVLAQVSAINKQYEKIAQLSGEKFNIFDILKLSTREVRTHSAFIGELLNPKGSHGQKETFLKLFCDLLGVKDFNCSTGILEIEKHIGFISDDYMDGGYIDIIINDGNKSIIVENKIYAVDQKNQLLRYHNHGVKTNKPFQILYLTLHGTDPELHSTLELKDGKDFNKISYSVNIIQWLDLCKEKSVNHPILRETISQYIFLIKKLTGQTMNNQMNEDITTILTLNGDNIKASIEIHNSLNAAKQKLLYKFGKKLEEKINTTNTNLITEVNENFGWKWSGLNIKPFVDSKEYIQLSFLSHLSDFYLEIVNDNTKSPSEKNKNNLEFYKLRLSNVKNSWGKIENIDTNWNGDWVCRYSKLDNLFYDTETWAKIANDDMDNIINDVAQDISELFSVLEEKIQTINV